MTTNGSNPTNKRRLNIKKSTGSKPANSNPQLAEQTESNPQSSLSRPDEHSQLDSAKIPSKNLDSSTTQLPQLPPLRNKKSEVKNPIPSPDPSNTRVGLPALPKRKPPTAHAQKPIKNSSSSTSQSSSLEPQRNYVAGKNNSSTSSPSSNARNSLPPRPRRPSLTPQPTTPAAPATPHTQPAVSPHTQPAVSPHTQPTTPAAPATPHTQPTTQPAVSPHTQPTTTPYTQPVVSPHTQPTTQPAVSPYTQPTTPAAPATPHTQPTTTPYTQPAVSPYTQPTTPAAPATPHTQPTTTPYTQPAVSPHTQPTTQPAVSPHIQPTTTPYTQPAVSPHTQPITPHAQPTTPQSASQQAGSSPSTNPSSTQSAAAIQQNTVQNKERFASIADRIHEIATEHLQSQQGDDDDTDSTSLDETTPNITDDQSPIINEQISNSTVTQTSNSIDEEPQYDQFQYSDNNNPQNANNQPITDADPLEETIPNSTPSKLVQIISGVVVTSLIVVAAVGISTGWKPINDTNEYTASNPSQTSLPIENVIVDNPDEKGSSAKDMEFKESTLSDDELNNLDENNSDYILGPNDEKVFVAKLSTEGNESSILIYNTTSNKAIVNVTDKTGKYNPFKAEIESGQSIESIINPDDEFAINIVFDEYLDHIQTIKFGSEISREKIPVYEHLYHAGGKDISDRIKSWSVPENPTPDQTGKYEMGYKIISANLNKISSTENWPNQPDLTLTATVTVTPKDNNTIDTVYSECTFEPEPNSNLARKSPENEISLLTSTEQSISYILKDPEIYNSTDQSYPVRLKCLIDYGNGKGEDTFTATETVNIMFSANDYLD